MLKLQQVIQSSQHSEGIERNTLLVSKAVGLLGARLRLAACVRLLLHPQTLFKHIAEEENECLPRFIGAAGKQVRDDVARLRELTHAGRRAYSYHASCVHPCRSYSR